MWTVISEKDYQTGKSCPFSSFAHFAPDSAIKHAEARQLLTGLVYVVLYDSKQIYTTHR